MVRGYFPGDKSEQGLFEVLSQTKSNAVGQQEGHALGLSDLGFAWPKLCLVLDLPQVLEVVRANYDTLTLKLQDGLDQYERYSEQHKEAAFFKELVSLLCLISACVSWEPFPSHWVLLVQVGI